MTDPHPILTVLREGRLAVYTIASKLRRVDSTRDWSNEEVESELSNLIRARLVRLDEDTITGGNDYALTKAGLKAISPVQRKKGKKGA